MNVPLFSERNAYRPEDAQISIRHEAPEWLRQLAIRLAYESGLHPSDLRSQLCRLLLETEDPSNWSEFPNIDGEVRELARKAPWYVIYDLIEWIHRKCSAAGWQSEDVGPAAFAKAINNAFHQKGVGWQLIEGQILVRGEEIFEASTNEAIRLTEASGREVARQELKEALHDLSRRPQPEITGAIQHSMAALECIAKDVIGNSKLTLGEWVKKNPTMFPAPVGMAVEKLWGYASQYGRHVQEGKPADQDEAELVVGLASALSVYLLRKHGV